MKNWNFSLRDGSDTINIDFDTNSMTKVRDKLNNFFYLAGQGALKADDHVESSADADDLNQYILETHLKSVLENLQEEFREVLSQGTDPSKEDELGELIDAFERVLDYVESQL
jgi:predicted DNA-binding protein (UPF0278 family)